MRELDAQQRLLYRLWAFLGLCLTALVVACLLWGAPLHNCESPTQPQHWSAHKHGNTTLQLPLPALWRLDHSISNSTTTYTNASQPPGVPPCAGTRDYSVRQLILVLMRRAPRTSFMCSATHVLHLQRLQSDELLYCTSKEPSLEALDVIARTAFCGSAGDLFLGNPDKPQFSQLSVAPYVNSSATSGNRSSSNPWLLVCLAKDMLEALGATQLITLLSKIGKSIASLASHAVAAEASRNAGPLCAWASSGAGYTVC